MVTNLAIDPDLLDPALQVSGERTKKAAVTMALQEFTKSGHPKLRGGAGDAASEKARFWARRLSLAQSMRSIKFSLVH